MRARAWASCCVLSLLALPALRGMAQAPAPKPAVATVGTRRIERDEYDHRVSQAEQQAATRGGERPGELRDLLRRQILETLIRQNLLVLEARRTGITVSGAEAESVLKRDPFFSPNGRFDAQRWQLTQATQAGQFRNALIVAGDQLAARRLDEQLQRRFRPAEAALRARAVRQLRRAVTEDLSLRGSEFNGHYPEPREIDVLAFYRRNLDQWRRPDRATLSVVFVNDPPMTQVERTDAGAGAAWRSRMRASADSLIARVRGGERLEDVASRLGGPRPAVQVLPDNFPGYWKGDVAQTAEVFRTAVGTVMRDAIPSTDGYLVVRVDQLEPAHVAPLAQVSREIRGKLREDSRLHHDERERLALYESLRDSLSGPAWVFRWAAVDTAAIRVPEPGEQDLDRWYRGHLADFSSFDSRTGTIVAKPLSEVREEVRLRWRRDRRAETARVQADELYRAWSANRRAAALEAALRVRESVPSPMGADIDTGFTAAALSDTLWRRGEPRGAGIAPYARGFFVWQVVNRVAQHTPSFAQVEAALGEALAARRRALEESSAKRLFESDPKRFGGGRVVHFTRMVVPQPPIDQVKLTRQEVERWHRRNLAKYSAQELVRAQHILISPVNASAAADRAARVRADSLLARIRAGESFDELAARFSDDPATKDKGGDVGVFARGAMLEPFENAVFAMKEGDLGGPIKTEAGYHIIRCTEHVEEYVQPLKLVYGIVASDLARVEADTVAMHRADSLLRSIKTAAQGRALARRWGFETIPYMQPVDQPMINKQLEPYFERLYAMKAGEVMPVKWVSKGEGYWITWVDSIGAPGTPTWEAARARAIAAYRDGAGERALMAKTAEMDSLVASGWSFDSLGVLWGGLNRSRELVASGVSERSNIPASLDSLVFGREDQRAALEPGQLSGWVRWPGGLARVRLVERQEPTADRVTARAEELRKVSVERKLAPYFDELKRRYPVRILDRGLEALPLPEPPPED